MTICTHCGVQISGERRHCPLCGKKLSDMEEGVEEDFAVFPRVKPRMSYNLIVRIATLAAVVAIVVINIINASFIPDLALYVPLSLSVGCAWLIIIVGVRKHKNIPKNILYEAIISALLCLLWDQGTGWRGWSVNYVVPLTVGALNAFYFVMSFVDRVKNTQYNIYFVISLIGTAATLVLLLCGVVEAKPFVSIPIGAGVSLLIAQLIFRGKNFLSELHRRFHV